MVLPMDEGRIRAAAAALKNELSYIDDIREAKATTFNLAAAVLRAADQYDADQEHAAPLAPGYHGEGALADFDPGTGRSSQDDWLKD